MKKLNKRPKSLIVTRSMALQLGRPLYDCSCTIERSVNLKKILPRWLERLKLLLLAVAFSPLKPSFAACDRPEIWFGPKTWSISPLTNKIDYSKYDFAQFIMPNASWPVARSRISVLSLPGNIVWSYSDLAALVSFVNENRFQIAFGDGMLFSDGKCGVGVEGVSTDKDFNHETVKIAELWKKAGGRLDYMVMDGPYFYGHVYSAGCHYSISDVAAKVAATLKGVFDFFPDVKVIDAEGPGTMSNKDWLEDLGTFFSAFQYETGHAIDAVAMDLHWSDLRPGETWQNTAREGAKFFHTLGTRAGLIIDADGTKINIASDSAWMDQNRSHIQQTLDAQLNLDFLSIDSWTAVPSHNLPENDSTAFVSLVNDAYMRICNKSND